MTIKREDIDDFDVWWKYEQEGWTYQQIADYYDVSKTTIYYRLHLEKQKEVVKRFAQTDKHKVYMKEYEQTVKRKVYMKEYRQSDKRKESVKTYFQSNKGKDANRRAQKTYEQTENGKECIKIFWQSEKGKELRRKHAAFRRELDYIPLNEPFGNSHAHHVNKEVVIYIPSEIHRSIYHNVWNGQNMEAINKEAFEFLDYELREEAWSKITGDCMIGEY